MSKDITISYNGSQLIFKYLDWDTHFFQRKSYLFDYEKSQIGLSSEEMAILLEKELKNCFVSAKIPSYEVDLIDFFQNIGFKFIDDELILKSNKNFVESANELEFFEEKSSLKIDFSELSNNFKFSRFHNDCLISNEKADELWFRYFENFKISDVKRAFIAKYQEEIAGIILVNIHGKKATLFVVSVRDKFHGKGIGSFLINRVISSLTEYEIYTETQVKNIEALNFYIKNSFTIIDRTFTVMHRW